MALEDCQIRLKNIFGNKGIMPKIPELFFHNPGISELKKNPKSLDFSISVFRDAIPTLTSKNYLRHNKPHNKILLR